MEKFYKKKAGRIWPLRHINEFHGAQWKFHAPIISTAEQLYDFGRCTLPFIDKNTTAGKGAYGTVYKYEIHDAHFEDPLNPNKYRNCVVAVKELNKTGGKVARHWGAEVRALARMNKLKQKHIVRFLTAFRRGKPDDLEHYVIFEWADGGNLSNLWAATRQPELSIARTKWVIEQLHGLAQALSAAHYLQEEDGHYYGASYRHGDLKPANILWFWDGSSFGTLKIGDWGEAKEHDAVTVLRHGTTAQFATRRYEPPEVVTGLHFGCIALEFIIWLLYGEDGRKKFDKNNRGDHGMSDMFYEVSSEGIASVHGAVKHWMTQMSKDPRCHPQKTALGDLLEVTRKGLLAVKVPLGGGTIDSYDHKHQVFEKQDFVLSGQTLTLNVPLRHVTVQSEVLDTVPSIVIQAEPMNTPTHSCQESEKAERFRATELVEQLSHIIHNNQGESYWYNGSPATSMPWYPGKSSNLSITPHSMSRKTKPGGLGVPEPDKVDYGNPKLDPENWDFILDNKFAANMLSSLATNSNLPSFADSPAVILCRKCQEFHNKMWSPLVKVTYSTQRLMQNAAEKNCDLCCLLWQTCQEHCHTTSGTASATVQFQRWDSTLAVVGRKHPVLTLFRNNGTSQASDIQIGFSELPNVGEDLQFVVLRGWINDCDSEHSKSTCKPSESREGGGVPTRLIDIGDKDGDTIRLVETSNKRYGDWVALSYRWGARPYFSTTRQNLTQHLAGMELGKLPLTFQDAIKVTRALRRRYLWIDSICIIQGDDGDFSDESKRMEDVYSGAYCVLAASRATDQRSGFLLPRPKKRKCVALGPKPGAESVIYVCERIENFKDHVLDGALSQRGWILQEHALARRTIFFTEHQTYWECGDEFPKILNPATHGERIIRFQELYQRYSRLSLSNDYDRPTAINGLQQRLLRTMDVRGGYGVFDDCENPGLLRRSLLWYRGSDENLKAIVFPNDREKVPSWSWMGVSGGIDYFPLPFFRFDWKEVRSPWSNPSCTIVGNELVTDACEFDSSFAKSLECQVIFDTFADYKQCQTKAVVLGVEKGHKATEDKRHYILVVIPTTTPDSDGSFVCKRVGAGYVPGRCL
ncbi:hypothetical protein GQ44DRAFT_659386, partial [Phaeosphaeriaceae sp. PMI808]